MNSKDFNDVLRDDGADVLRAMFDRVPSPPLIPSDAPPTDLTHEDETPELRSYQADVVDRTEQQDSNVCLVAATGAGKTVIGAAIVRRAVARGERVLVLAHTREIVMQTSSKLRRAGHQVCRQRAICADHASCDYRRPRSPTCDTGSSASLPRYNARALSVGHGCAAGEDQSYCWRSRSSATKEFRHPRMD
jgi:hypothetical protein